jgi:uncharacterized membrane protein
MSDLLVVAFDQLDDAQKAMQHVRGLEKQGQIKIEDSAVLSRSDDGKVHVKNELTGATETGAVIGAVVGSFVLFLFPVAGAAIGAAAGGAIGSMLKSGVEPAFVKELEQQLSPGRSALFLVVREGSAGKLIAALRPFKGDLLQTTLPAEAEEELRRALSV